MWHGPLRITSPPVRINDDLIIDDRFWQILCTHQNEFVGKNFQHSTIQGGSNDKDTYFLAPFLKNSFVYIVTETVGDYPYPYLSEKTWKAMVSKVPFMMIGSPGNIAKLQEFGFKTFSNWWNEDYDTLPTVAQRIESIVKELEILSKLPLTELIELRKDIASTVDFNFNHLITFKSNDLANIQKKL